MLTPWTQGSVSRVPLRRAAWGVCPPLGTFAGVCLIPEFTYLRATSARVGILSFFLMYLFISGWPGSSLLHGLFSSCGEPGLLFFAAPGPLLLWNRGSRAHGLQYLRLLGSGAQASVTEVHGFSCPKACGIFPDKGSNPCLLQRQVDSYPLRHQGRQAGILFFLFTRVPPPSDR